MAFVHEDSCPCAKSELDLFCLPPTQTSILKSRSIEYSPISILGNGPVEFAVSGSGEDYTDLANTYLHVICKVLHSDGSKLKDGENIAPVNNLLHSMWSQIDLYLNDMLITPSTITYPYRAYLETLLSFDESVKRNRLRSALCDDDWGGTRDDYDRNRGHIRRRSCVRKSQPVELYGRLHVDLFMQERFLVNGVDMKLKLSRSKPEFVLMGDSADYQIKLEQVHLYVRKVTLNPAVLLAHAKALDKTPAKYPVQSGNENLRRHRRGADRQPPKRIHGSDTEKNYRGDGEKRLVQRRGEEEPVLFRTQLDRFHRVTRERGTVPVESVQAGL